jgi:hypothetical protein
MEIRELQSLISAGRLSQFMLPTGKQRGLNTPPSPTRAPSPRRSIAGESEGAFVIVRKDWSIAPRFESLRVVETQDRVGQRDKNGAGRKEKMREDRRHSIITSPEDQGDLSSPCSLRATCCSRGGRYERDDAKKNCIRPSCVCLRAHGFVLHHPHPITDTATQATVENRDLAESVTLSVTAT